MTDQPRRKPGRPPKNVIKRIPAPAEEIARALFNVARKKRPKAEAVVQR